MAEGNGSSQGTFWDTGEPMKRCTVCGKTKPLDQFFVHKGPSRRRPVRSSHCKTCHMAKARKRYADEPDRYRNIYKKIVLKGRFGITLEDFEQMRQRCGDLCEICGRPETRIDSRHLSGNRTSHLQVDHNHKTGSVRGLLCSNCNLMIGNARENPEILLAAIAYLQKHAE